jgi:gamma-glutamyltranspeptidase / glutathione hydrolase
MLAPSVTRHAASGMVSTIDHLATTAGVDLLRRGGSAVDAAIGANAVLSVTSSHMCGMGGDLWALVHHDDGAPPATLDASGRAGSGADPGRARADGLRGIPLTGDIRAVTVPGAVDGWLALHERFGRLPLTDVFAAAVGLARDGFPVAPILAFMAPDVAGIAHNELPAAPEVGEMVIRPGSARALAAIAERGRDGFYGGEFGEGLLAAGPDEFTAADLDVTHARWVDPLSVDAFGHRLWTTPPTSQGYLTLLSAAIVDPLDPGPDGAGTHQLVEAATLAAHDRPNVLFEGADPAHLLAAERIADRRAAIDPDRAGHVAVPEWHGDTTYLCVIDGDGMGVSLINSNASGFGAGIIAGTSGIFLHDRGLGFSLESGHPAEYGPRRRPPHTLSPALVTHTDGRLRTVLGTMGGDTQPQYLLQILAASLLHGRDPGRAIGQGRWKIAPDDDGGGFDTWRPGHGREVRIEDHVPAEIRDGLTSRGHHVKVTHSGEYGHAHMIEVTDHGSLAGAADPRALTGMAGGL